jgi:hypothetical protein
VSDPFAPEVLAQAVHDTLDAATASLSPTTRRAIIFDATKAIDGKPEARALYVQRAPTGWNVVLEADWKGGHDLAGKAAVIKEWK